MRKLFTLTFFLGFIFQVYSQQASISGNVFIGDSISTISGVALLLEGSNNGAITDELGYYLITGTLSGEYTLVITHLGFERIEHSFSIANSEKKIINFYLKKVYQQLPVFTIESTSITGGENGVNEILGAAHYIGVKELQKYSYTDINRALRSVPGINLQEEDGFGLRPNIGLRGTGTERSSKITIMEDGVLSAPAPYAAPAAYYFPTLGRMKAIEIIKGSSQIKYGPYTTGGAINLMSTEIPDNFSGYFQILGGSFGAENIHVNVGNSYDQISILLETFQYSADGFKELDGGGDTGFDKKDYLAKVELKNKKDAKVQQSLLFKLGLSSESSNETYLGLTAEDFMKNPYRRYVSSQMDLMKTEHRQLSIRHNIKFPSHISLSSVVYQNNFNRNWYKLDALTDTSNQKTNIVNILDDPENYSDQYSALIGENSPSNFKYSVKANNRQYYSRGIQTILNWNHSGKYDQKIQFGIRVHQDEADRFQWVDDYIMHDKNLVLDVPGIPGTESNRIEKADALASFLQYHISSSKFLISPGIRFEHIALRRDDFGINDILRFGLELESRSNRVNVFIPGLGLSYQLNSNMNTFLGIHRGFSPQSSKSGSEPEQSVNYEFGIRISERHNYMQLLGFFNDYQNLLGSDLAAAGGTSSGELFNAGAAQVKGVELQFTSDILASGVKGKVQLPINLVYTYTDARFKSDFQSEFEGWGDIEKGDYLPYLANHQLNLMIGLEHDYYNINLSGRFVNEMRTQPSKGEIPENQKTSAHFVLDGSAKIKLRDHVSLFLNATNLGNQVYMVARRPAGIRPGMPRAFNAGLKVDF